MRQFGLIGKKLTHSFSEKYFSGKFERERLDDCSYQLFEIADISYITELFSNPELEGLNVTIPYKQEIIPYLDALDVSAKKVGAVNVVRIRDGKKTGFNSDLFGFQESLKTWLGDYKFRNALILGTGGASRAVEAALTDMGIRSSLVSRHPSEYEISYKDLSAALIKGHKLIINTTPLGMYPDIDQVPNIPFSYISEEHFLYDLVYNPEETTFMRQGAEKGAKVKNGLEMLHLQADRSWEIWNS